MSRKLFLAAAVPVIFAAGLWAQSRITGGQLRAGSKTPTFVIAIDGEGRFHSLRLGPGLSIEAGELRFAAPQINDVPPERLSPGADGSFIYRTRISRNGLVQTPGVDYRVDAGRIIPLMAWADDDIVTAF